MTIKMLFFIILIICLTQYPSLADVLQIISQEIDRSDITVGDKVTYTITVVSDKDTPNVAPLAAKSEHLEISFPKINPTDKSRSNQNEVIKQIVYQIVPFEPGENEIPPVSITYGSRTVKSKVMRFEVRNVLPENAKEMEDIKKPLDMPRNWLAYFIFGVVIPVIFGSSLYFIKRYSIDREASIPQKPSHLPHEIAYERLAQVKQMDLSTNESMKEYYSRVAQIIKTYIGERFEINALESTSYELMQQAKIQALSKSVREMLRDFLKASDFVKFAKYTSDKAEAHKLLEQAREFIDETKVSRSKVKTLMSM